MLSQLLFIVCCKYYQNQQKRELFNLRYKSRSIPEVWMLSGQTPGINYRFNDKMVTFYCWLWKSRKSTKWRLYYCYKNKIDSFLKSAFCKISSTWRLTHLVLCPVPCGVPEVWMEFYSQSSLLYVARSLYQQHWRMPPTERKSNTRGVNEGLGKVNWKPTEGICQTSIELLLSKRQRKRVRQPKQPHANQENLWIVYHGMVLLAV